jgi:iron complex outermembrane receptor protein
VKKIVLLCTTAMLPSVAFAQSTGTVEFEKQAIVVTGTRARDVGGVLTPDTSKAKVVLTQQAISRQSPGQTILDTINQVPGVSFQNNDAYGSAGGTLNIRGFDSSRISLTFDGIPLNDSGNYAIFSNQQLDPELIEQVNVNLGSTDVDSPTASAVGGTVNYRTIVPTVKPGVRLVGTVGDWNMWRVFGLVNTGEIGPWGTRMFISGSREKYNVPFNFYGHIDKKQVNARIYQTLGNNGDFVSLAGNYNENRNTFFGSLPLRTDINQSATQPLVPRIVGPNSQNRYPTTGDERFYHINYPCTMAVGRAGIADAPAPAPNADQASCGTEFDRRYNPSNTGNIRGSSRFTLGEGLVLTVDPSYQYVKANGGGTVTGQEGAVRDVNPAGGTASTASCRTTPNSATNTCIAGYLGGTPYFGRDLNGDGDTLDTVTVVAPSQTHTDRYGLIAGLRWDFAKGQMFRVAYTLDDARHRQTGEVGQLQSNGEPVDVFPRNNGLTDSLGFIVQKRDRKSFAVLHQASAEYRGDFGALTVNVGLRAPYFIRNLNNYCFTSSASGFVECTGRDPTRDALLAQLNPQVVDPVTGRVVSGWSPPQSRRFTYKKLLPNVGLIYDILPQLSAFTSYSRGLSVPSTDNLYNSFFFPITQEAAKPKPEVTDSFDGGLRYRTSKIQAQLSGWYTHFTNRQASAFDPELNVSVFRNLGTVNKWGVDGSIAYQPYKALTLTAFGSWNRSKIEDNIQIGALPVGTTCDTVSPTSAQGLQNCAFTKGNRESGSPSFTYGVSAYGDAGPFELGVQVKRTGPRFIFDDNLPVFRGDIGVTTTPIAPGQNRVVQELIYAGKAPAYTLVNLEGRLKLAEISPRLRGAYLQFNLYNAFDTFYVGGFGGGLAQSTSTRTCNAASTPSCTVSTVVPTWGSPPFVQLGAPRTASVTLNLEF